MFNHALHDNYPAGSVLIYVYLCVVQEFLDSSTDEGSESGENSVDLGPELGLDQLSRLDHRLDPDHLERGDHSGTSPDCLQDHLNRQGFSTLKHF